MTAEHPGVLRTAVVGVAALVAGAALATWWLRPQPTPAPMAGPAVVVPPAEAGPVEIRLSADAITRAGIRTAFVETGRAGSSGPFPARIEANQYQSVEVTSTVPGRVKAVAVAVGDQVAEGQVLAEIDSPDLADAAARYLTMTSEFDAVHQRLLRTERLVAIGAASTQELERVRAEHTTHETDIETARARLRFLGATTDEIAALSRGMEVAATIRVRAPRAGVVVSRSANAGLTVEPSTPLFLIVDLSSVWVMAEVHERDLATIAIDRPASVTIPANPAPPIRSRVAYIDPEVRAETRTTRVRIEIPNPAHRLRLGMFADVAIDGTGTVTVIPRAATQTIGDRQVVYVVDPSVTGRFVERAVELGAADGDRVVVLTGLSPGEQIVTAGSFALRAERDRLGLGTPTLTEPAAPAAAPTTHDDHPARPAGSAPTPTADAADYRIEVGANGFTPGEIRIAPGRAVQLTFVRTTDQTCATEVVFPSLGIRRTLPLDQPVAITVPPQAGGEIVFACGMNMFKGQLRVATK